MQVTGASPNRLGKRAGMRVGGREDGIVVEVMCVLICARRRGSVAGENQLIAGAINATRGLATKGLATRGLATREPLDASRTLARIVAVVRAASRGRSHVLLSLKEWRARSAAGTELRAGLKTRAAVIFGLGENDGIVVNEIACQDPGCPDVETVFLLMRAGAPTRALKVSRPMAEVTDEDMRAAYEALPEA